MDTGFFTMADVQRVLDCGSVDEARVELKSKIAQFRADHPRTHLENLAKVDSAINKARSKHQLAFTVTNFVLAHPSEGLKVIS